MDTASEQGGKIQVKYIKNQEYIFKEKTKY